MSNALLPSNFAAPFITSMPAIRYDSRGRQMGFTESNAQRLEREAFAGKSNNGSASPSPPSSGNSTPTRQLIQGPFCDPIELMANRLAEELFGDDFSSSSDEDPFALYSTPPPTSRVPSSSTRSSSRRKSSSSSSNRARRRNSNSLSSIPEED